MPAERASLSDQPERRHFDAFVPLELREEITAAHTEVARLRAALEMFTAACDEFRSRGKIVPAVISAAERVAREALNGGETK